MFVRKRLKDKNNLSNKRLKMITIDFQGTFGEIGVFMLGFLGGILFTLMALVIALWLNRK